MQSWLEYYSYTQYRRVSILFTQTFFKVKFQEISLTNRKPLELIISINPSYSQLRDPAATRIGRGGALQASFSHLLEKLEDAVPDACWPAAMIILISNFCAPPHGEEVGREMRALSRTSAGPHYMEEIFTCGGGRVYFELGGWRKLRGAQGWKKRMRKRPFLAAAVLEDFNLAR